MVTGLCNISCDYCIAKDLPRIAMTTQIGRAAIDLFLDLATGCSTVDFVFTGGEPLTEISLLSNLTEYARTQANNKGISPNFILKTNGIIANKKAFEYLNCFRPKVVISIDGDHEAHDAHRKIRNITNTHNIIIGNILKFIKSDMDCSASLTVHPDQAANVLDSVRFLRDLGIDEINIAPAYGTTHWSPEQISQLSKSIIDVAYFIRGAKGDVGPIYRNTVHVNKQLQGVWGCEAASTTLAFLPDGSIAGCSALAMLVASFPELILGNTSDGLDQTAIDYTIKLASATEIERPECAFCRTADNCAGGCLAFNLSSTLAPFSPPKIYCSTISIIPEAWNIAWNSSR